MLVSKTYDVVTPESAAQGDFADSGYEYTPCALNSDCGPRWTEDLKREIEELNCPRLNDWDHGSASIYGDEGHTDYRTGAVTTYALHFRFDNKYEARAFRRVWLMFFVRR